MYSLPNPHGTLYHAHVGRAVLRTICLHSGWWEPQMTLAVLAPHVAAPSLRSPDMLGPPTRCFRPSRACPVMLVLRATFWSQTRLTHGRQF